MKKIIQIFALILLVTASVDAQAQKNTKFQTTTFSCNLDCPTCETKIMKSIPYERGIKDVEVDFPNKEVTVKYKRSKNSDDELIKAFKELGYKAVVKNEEDEPKPEPEKTK